MSINPAAAENLHALKKHGGSYKQEARRLTGKLEEAATKVEEARSTVDMSRVHEAQWEERKVVKEVKESAEEAQARKDSAIQSYRSEGYSCADAEREAARDMDRSKGCCVT